MTKKSFSNGISSILLLIFLASLILFGYFVFTGRIDRNLFNRLISPYCNIPIKITIGNIDPRFKISSEILHKELTEASEVWEKEAGKDLFVFDGKNKSTVTVNFIYDERQQEALESSKALADLKAAWSQYESLVNSRKTLGARYDALKIKYENDVLAYNKKLNAYEARVEAWNQSPGSREEFNALKQEEASVNKSYSNLEAERKQVNNLAAEVNNDNSDITNLYEELSIKTKEYNKNFASDDQITVGEYDGNYDINIYQYVDLNQLKITLAHELGHSLGMDHTQNEISIMYPLQSKQSGNVLLLTEEDKAELLRVCKSKIE